MKEDIDLPWIEIMSGPGMSEWIESNDRSLWHKLGPRGIYCLHPKLYFWWKLRYR